VKFQLKKVLLYGCCCWKMRNGGEADIPELMSTHCQFPCFIIQEKLAKCKFGVLVLQF